ncbi:MAG: hypothetical protein ABSD96_07175 [Candidatus Korobacteraceae bacterium]|jgi:hypothetical protein
MRVRAENLRAFNADSPITKSCAFGGAGNNTDVLGHDLILQNDADFAGRESFIILFKLNEILSS